ncbi:MAG TPA: SHOCT domain-containing protein [Actinokineospora sp.]|nr:SHOCT domain-containing protein [Actinokineospora sp.]
MFGYGHWGGYGMGWFGVAMAVVTMVVFWGGLVTVAVVLVRRFGKPHAAGSARTILDERYARGEIDAEEYQARRTSLDA